MKRAALLGTVCAALTWATGAWGAKSVFLAPSFEFSFSQGFDAGSYPNIVSNSSGNSVAAGEMIYLALDYSPQSVELTAVMDNQGNAYQYAFKPVDCYSGFKCAVLYAIAQADGPITISYGMSAPFQIFDAHQVVYSGINPLVQVDATASNQSTTSTDVSGGTVTTRAPFDLIVSFMPCDQSILSPGPGYSADSTYHNDLVESMAAHTPGDYTPTATANSPVWSAFTTAFYSDNGQIAVTPDGGVEISTEDGGTVRADPDGGVTVVYSDGGLGLPLPIGGTVSDAGSNPSASKARLSSELGCSATGSDVSALALLGVALLATPSRWKRRRSSYRRTSN